MAGLALYGTLRDAALLGAVLGRDDARTVRCEIRDHAVRHAGDAPYPLIRAAPGDAARAVCLTDPDAGTLARLDYYEGAFGYVRQAVELRIDGRIVHGETYFPTAEPAVDGPAWHLAEWQARWGALSRLAAEEAMNLMGHLDADALGQAMPMIRSRAAARLRAGSTPAPADIRSATPADAVAVASREVVHIGFFTTHAYELRHPLLEGGQSARVRREVFVATDAAIVLPYDPRRDRVLLVEQFRMGPFGRGDPCPWMLEPVAGRVDPGETPEAAAKRECLEEAGLGLSSLERIGSHYASPGCSTEYFHCFVGLCDLADGIGGGSGGLDSEHEDIRRHVLPFDAAMRLLETGEADNAPLVLSLLWLERARARLRASA